MIQFFLRRPIFAAVCSLIVTLAGLISIPTLPIAQYPRIAPPVVTINAIYTGANAQAVESAVTTPLEQAVNGVEGLRYITSSSSNNGTSSITCTFNLGTNLDIAATDVQNAIQSASGLLPNEVKQTGITVSKNSGTFVMVAAMKSNNPQFNQLFLSNYTELNVVNAIKRVPGVSDVLIFGQRRYAMRVWVNPQQLQARNLAVTDVLNALQEQNVEVAAGSIGAAPERKNQPFTISVHAEGRLSTPEQFRNIIVRADPNGGFTRLGDVARVELGAEDYSSSLAFNGNPNVVGLGILQLPTANALQVAQGVRKELDLLSRTFPAGVSYQIAFDTTDFVRESIKEVVLTLIFSIALVVLVIFLFLQNPRSTVIPAVTLPVSLIGTFAVMKLFGFTINTITLFGLTLATGLVVDDAIVVIENIARYIQEKKMGGIEGAAAAMHEVQGAVVASSLVLLAVFVPVAFFPGTTGQLYKQFALTIAASITISLFASLTLTPVMSALMLSGERESHFPFFVWFNRGLANFRAWYRGMLPKFFRRRWAIAGLFLAALAATFILFRTTPTAFIPDEDQGYFIVTLQLPEGASLSQEQVVAKRVEKIIFAQPEVAALFNVSGFSFTGSGPNRGIAFARLKPWSDRRGSAHSLNAVLQRVQMQFFGIPNAQVFAFNPPPIQGVGNFGGFQFELEDRGNVGLPALMQTAYGYMGLGNQNPNLRNVFTTFRIDAPQYQVHIDRAKAKSVGVPLSDVFRTMQTDLGSFYVNDFDYLNRSYRVYVQAEEPYRSSLESLQFLYVRSQQGGMIPLSGLGSATMTKSAPIITHYNLFRSIEINGTTAPGHGSGQAIAAMEQLAQKIDPAGVGYEWSGTSLDEIEGGSLSVIIFFIGIIFVFLVLAAQYESFVDPLIVLLAVPVAILGALVFMNARGLPTDAYAQVGFVMLIGLASKSAILIVEFANQQMKAGADIVTAAARAAQTRLRPILMTSIAFIVAVTPLVFASGAGSAARNSLGTVVFGGMIVSTLLNLAITPVLYVIVKSWSVGRRRGGTPGRTEVLTAPAPEPRVPV
ncbi:MAG TPA: multidrug efflux RND transporter permease subunit [Candidatus Baltobacteraceae bacterium]|nr:multidrug efflux RND transporter permease subunit [Candidatus Baltobacteraceae bacterium]